MIEQFFNEPVAPQEVGGVVESLRRTLEDDETLRKLSEQGRSDLTEKLRGLRVGRKATRAYMSDGHR